MLFNYKEYYHFSEKVYEDSPLGRVRKYMVPEATGVRKKQVPNSAT